MAKQEGLHVVRKIENVTEYEALSDSAKARVDKQVEELRSANSEARENLSKMKN